MRLTEATREVVLGTVFMLIGENSRAGLGCGQEDGGNQPHPTGRVKAVTVDRTVHSGQSDQHREKELV